LLALLVVPPGVRANEYLLPEGGDDVVGAVEHVRADAQDTFVDIAQRYGAGFDEMKLANPKVDPWLPKAGTTVAVPTRFVLPAAPRNGVVLNIAELRLYYFPAAAAGEPRRVFTYPVSVGRLDWRTPLGTTRVVRKVTGPVWTPPESIRREHAALGEILPAQVPPGPDNPLGPYALYLGISGYLLHGTDARKQNGIGIIATHGCVRLYNEDVETLHRQVPVGTQVNIVDQSYKAGWKDGTLYLEVHPPFGAEGEADLTHLSEAVQVVSTAAGARPDYPVDWKKVEAEVLAPTGMPVAIGPRLPSAVSHSPASPAAAVGASHPRPAGSPAAPARAPSPPPAAPVRPTASPSATPARSSIAQPLAGRSALGGQPAAARSAGERSGAVARAPSGSAAGPTPEKKRTPP
jgi:L,D-transpeptidase ErfK/SrfK